MNALHYLMAHLKAAQIKRDERGVTALEYALIAGLVGLAVIAGATTLGSNISAKYVSIGTAVTNAGVAAAAK